MKDQSKIIQVYTSKSLLRTFEQARSDLIDSYKLIPLLPKERQLEVMAEIIAIKEFIIENLESKFTEFLTVNNLNKDS